MGAVIVIIIIFLVLLAEAGEGRLFKFWIFISLIWGTIWFYAPLENEFAIIGIVLWWLLFWVIDPD